MIQPSDENEEITAKVYYIQLLFAVKEVLEDSELTTADIARAIALENKVSYSANLRKRVLTQLKHLEKSNLVERRVSLSKTKTTIYVWSKIKT